MKISQPVPMWQQVANYLRGEILRGVHPPGQLLPSEETLATEFGVSRPTVRQGIQALAAEGLVEIRRPRGTMVRDPHAAPAYTERHTLAPPSTSPSYDAPSAQSAERFTRNKQVVGSIPTAGWANEGQPSFVRVDATADLAGLLDIPVGEPMLVRQTLQHNDHLRRLTRLCMPFSVAAGTPWTDDPHLPAASEVYDHFVQAGHALTVTEYVRARMPIGDETSILAVPAGTPLLIVTELIVSTDGSDHRPLALCETRARADQIQLAYTVPAAPAGAERGQR
jgi:GntR family transcriptional regulator